MHLNSERQRQMGRQMDWSPLKAWEDVSSVGQSCLILWDTMNHCTPGLPVHHQLEESTQTHVHWVGDAIKPSHLVIPLLLHSIFPRSESFQMSQFFASSGQSIGVSASTSVLPMNTQDWSHLGWNGWTSLQSKGLSGSSPTPQVKSINSSVLSLLYGPTLTSAHDYWKNHSFDYMDFVLKVMFLLFNMRSRLVIASLPRSKHLLISCLQ